MSKKSYHHGNLREAIITAAREILDSAGVEGLSLRKVAQRTGVSATALYSHFSDKRELLAVLATRGFEDLTVRMEEEASGSVPDSAGPEPQLAGLARGYLLFAIDNKSLFQLMFGREVGDLPAYPQLVTAGEKSYNLMADCIALAVIKPGESNQAAIGAAAAWSMVHGLSMLIIDGRISANNYGAKNNGELVDHVCSMLSFNP